ncbi:F-box protein At1g30790-like [Arabidopsis lyrata subsp. lyrata]|uniref:F-box protein At1g30790-like n=1 Tax=Arabidopsis lyrata subsp. lyrata TaxID=81972 RepID=UPI000A29E93D|nr:F-box protein At1g30790-like [Arabidopsis lyrata subsp. lyrata]|eukprot:XP_020866091.1 F-box protein At1g30790-like [Arabidopsis lyrata subsp. lyrata]
MKREERQLIEVDPIPLDLELAILTRLPAKSLFKFLCVSKMWSSIIRSQSFVDSYYALSSTTRSRFIVTFGCGAQAKFEDRRLFVFSSSYECEKSSSLATNLDMTIPSSGSFIVFNPSTNIFNILPFTGARTSWAYDPVGDQFKSLTMVSYPHRPPDHLMHEVLTLGGGESSWTRNKLISPPHHTVTKSICINGFVYYGAWTPTRSANPVIVCFDVRFETLSFIEAPRPVVWWGGESILMEYKGKLASITRHPYADFQSFDLWILEDVKTHDWSKQTFQLPFSLGMGKNITSPGTNKAGEIIFAPKLLSYNDVQPYYIFYYNVERKDIRRVRLLGIADDEEFRHRYGIAGECYVWISPEHIESIATL